MLFRASPIDPILRTASAQADLEKYNNTTPSILVDSRATSPYPAPGSFARDISRPSSTSTQSSNIALLRQHEYNTTREDHRPLNGALYNHSLHSQHNHNLSLPGLSTLASLASASPSQLRSFSNNASHSMNYATSSPAPTPGLPGNTPPVCQNCQTSTTPLWRRDEAGSVLCNACGLFLKLHGRARPISLKTDVIKSRNRVKSAGQVPKKKPPFDTNGLPATAPDMGTPPFNMHNPRRSSQKASSGASDRSHSPVSRTDTPHMHHDPNIAPQHLFDGVTGVSLNEQAFQPSPSLPGLHLSHPSPGSTSSLIDRHLEPPQSYEQLFAANTQLKTKVSELEVINIMQRESAAREVSDLTSEVEELKRRIQELEHSWQERDAGQPPSKKARLSDSSHH